MTVEIYYHECTQIVEWTSDEFNEFLKCIAEEENIDLEEMQFFGGKKSWDKVNTPLYPLYLKKRRDEGFYPEECELMSNQLRDLMLGWEDDDPNTIKGRELVNNMDAVNNLGGHLDFFYSKEKLRK